MGNITSNFVHTISNEEKTWNSLIEQTEMLMKFVCMYISVCAHVHVHSISKYYKYDFKIELISYKNYFNTST